MAVPLNFSSSGDSPNPPVIVLHGLFGSSSNWRSVAGQLSSRFQVFCVDIRNHGRSGWSDSMGYLDMAHDLAAFIAENRIDRPRLIGHSMGGKAVMTYLQHHGGPVGRSAIIDIAPIAYSHDHDHLINALNGLDLGRIASRDEADRALSVKIPEPPLRQFLLQNLVRRSDGFAWRINLDAISGNRAELFGYPEGRPSNAELLFIRGGKSDYIQPQHFDEIARQFPHSSIRSIEDAGHWVHAEKSRELVEMLLDFLD